MLQHKTTYLFNEVSETIMHFLHTLMYVVVWFACTGSGGFLEDRERHLQVSHLTNIHSTYKSGKKESEMRKKG